MFVVTEYAALNTKIQWDPSVSLKNIGSYMSAHVLLNLLNKLIVLVGLILYVQVDIFSVMSGRFFGCLTCTKQSMKWQERVEEKR